jgi:hypothetical protein
MILYKGNPLAVQTPSLPPGAGRRRSVNLVDTSAGFDPANMQQAWQVLADADAMVNSGLWTRHQELYQLKSQSFTTQQDPIAAAPRLSFITSAAHSESLQIAEGGPSYWGQSGIIAPGTGAGGYAYLETSSKVAPFAGLGTGQYFIAEFDIAFNTAFSGLQSFYVGLADNQQINSGVAGNYALLIQNNGVWTFSYKVGGYSFGSAPMAGGFSPVVTSPLTFQRMRIELYGSTTAEGVAQGSAFCQVFVNDVLALGPLNVTTFPNVNMYLGAGSNYGTGTPSMTLGTFTYFWNRF